MVPGLAAGQVIHTTDGGSASDTAQKVMLLGVGGGGGLSPRWAVGTLLLILSDSILFSFCFQLTYVLKLYAQKKKRKKVWKTPSV